ncbi:MAG: hypothetical protein ABSG84_06605 [Acidobacteriaceae bacterium]|jgi:hypothetical protein
MSIRFTVGVGMVTLAIAIGVAAAPGMAQTPANRLQPYFAVRTIENQDRFGKTLSAAYSLEERDSSGRRLTAHLDSPVLGAKLTQATIWDPVKVRMIAINYVARTAMVTQFPPGAVDKMLPAAKPFATDDPNRSDIGDKMLNDFQVHGYTWTTEDPNLGADGVASGAAGAGTASASAFSPTAYPVTHEWWWSPVLRLFLLTTTRDGNGNQQVTRYDQIKVKEPTAEDFAIPPGFQVRTIQAQGGAR